MSVLRGVRVVELEAKGPGPFGVMLLADLGADVVRVDRATAAGRPAFPAALHRGRRSIALDLKDPGDLEVLLRLADTADVLVESFRPSVAERLGFGPEVCCGSNPRLVYARVTGWGQDGPLATTAAHDINFLAVAGALHPLGSADRPPPPPLNLVGDFAAGGTYLAVGVLAALLERERSGRGQVLDAAMVDGVASLLTAFHALRAAGVWEDERESNIVDGGAPWYRCYRTADGEYVAVGALEERFYRELLERLGLDSAAWPMHDRARWPALHARLEVLFAARTRAEWEERFAGSDACVTPVLSLADSVTAPQLAARETFVAGMPAAAPRLQRTPPRRAGPAPVAGQHTAEILAELGLGAAA